MSAQIAQRIDPASTTAVRARDSLDATANMLYAMGIQELRARGPRIAAHYFTVCLDRDPDFLLAKLRLAGCHKAMAPKLGDKKDWQAVAKQGTDALVASVVKGKGAMPPKGGAAALSNADIKAAVEYMAAQAK